MEQNLRPVLTVRLFAQGKCFGPGIAELLQKVEQLHSLRAAAADMEMAYSKAWTMVKACESNLGEKLLTYTTGGKHGGGAALTPFGAQLLDAYVAYCADMKKLGELEFSKYFSHIL